MRRAVALLACAALLAVVAAADAAPGYVDVQDPGARAVAREGSDGRDVTVPRRQRRMLPALRDDAGEAGAGDRRLAEFRRRRA